MTLQSAGSLAYLVTLLDLKDAGKTAEKGNIVQVWKYTGVSRQILTHVFAPIVDE